MADDVADRYSVVSDTFAYLMSSAVLPVAAMTYRPGIDRRMAIGFLVPFPAGFSCYGA